MGYEIAGGWGAKMATPDAEVIVMVGDGSYLMMNSDIYSSVLTGHKLIVVRLRQWRLRRHQPAAELQGRALLQQPASQDCRIKSLVEVDFAQACRSHGRASPSMSIPSPIWSRRFERAKTADRTTVIVIDTDRVGWTPGDAWWDVGVPANQIGDSVRKAAADHAVGKRKQRIGV